MVSAKRLKKSPSEDVPIMNKQEASSKSHSGGQPQNSAASDNVFREQSLQGLRQHAIAARTVECDQGIPIDQLMTMCQALVDSNREIWDRCKPFCCKYIPSDDPFQEKCIFMRVRGLVDAHTTTYGKYATNSCNELLVEATPYVTKRSFQIPIRLPARLEQLAVNPRPEEDDFMPDFGLLLNRSMLLIDDVVPTFLREFKTFLESQQAPLQNIHAWLFPKVDDHIAILQDEHGVDVSWNVGGLWKLDVPDSVDATEIYGVCVRCRKDYYKHDTSAEAGWVRCKTDEGLGCFPLVDGESKELLRCSFPGQLGFKASVETPEERRWLNKFLEFVGHTKSKPASGTPE